MSSYSYSPCMHVCKVVVVIVVQDLDIMGSEIAKQQYNISLASEH